MKGDSKESVVNETLRLYPPVAMIGREALVDVELGGFRIRKGTAVWPTPWITHRDPELWDRPLEFRPERWTSESRAGQADSSSFREQRGIMSRSKPILQSDQL